MPASTRPQLDQAAGGLQALLVITDVTGSGATAAVKEALIGQTLKGASIPANVTVTCQVDINGLRKLEVRLRLSTYNAVCTPAANSTLVDGITTRKGSTPAGAAFGGTGVEQVLAFADGDLLGEKYLLVTVVTTGGPNVFDRAEISGL